MSYDTKKQLRDGGTQLIAQYFDELLDDYRPLSGDEHGAFMQDVQAKAVLDDIYTRLGELTTEQKAEAIRLLLATIDGKVSTAAKQDAAKAVLDSIAGKDFATQATLAAVLTKLSADPSTSAKQDAAKLVLDTISTAVAARASEATLAQVKTELATVKSELATVKANQLSGDQKVQLSGSKTRVSSPPVTGVKTVTGVAAELFAGASRKAGRSRLVLRNMHSSLRLRIGPPTVTDSTGFGVEPQAVVEIDIDPASDVPWYAISEAGAIQVEVLEA